MPNPILRGRDEIQAHLQARGLLDQFREVRRRYLVATGSRDGGAAMRFAFASVCPDLADPKWVAEASEGQRKMDAWRGGVEDAPVKALKESRASDPRLCLQWVADNLALGSGVDVETAPGTAAVGLLRWAQGTSDAESDFWRAWMQRIPKEAVSDDAKGFEDDLRSLDRFLLMLESRNGDM